MAGPEKRQNLLQVNLVKIQMIEEYVKAIKRKLPVQDA